MRLHEVHQLRLEVHLGWDILLVRAWENTREELLVLGGRRHLFTLENLKMFGGNFLQFYRSMDLDRTLVISLFGFRSNTRNFLIWVDIH